MNLPSQQTSRQTNENSRKHLSQLRNRWTINLNLLRLQTNFKKYFPFAHLSKNAFQNISASFFSFFHGPLKYLTHLCSVQWNSWGHSRPVFPRPSGYSPGEGRNLPQEQYRETRIPDTPNYWCFPIKLDSNNKIYSVA